MIEKRYYKCTFLSDVVLPASSNTQGNIALSDFISGSNFLGMVASGGGYDSFDSFDDQFKVFHSGDVRFGDGHILIDGKLSYKMPLVWFKIKNADDVYNKLHISIEKEDELRRDQKQLKQMREGYINSDFKYFQHLYYYTQKSSYDKKHRRSKDEGMFGYSALPAGTEWVFKVIFKDDTYINKVEEKLKSSTRLGKSKTAQYGKIAITAIEEEPTQIESFTPKENLTYLYVNSRVALIDKCGAFELTPTIENLGLSSGCEIDWEKSQIKTISYNRYDFTRQTYDYLRVAIEKGSVIVVKGLNDDERENIKNGIGAYQSEGFGEILINPKFLEESEPKLEKELLTAKFEVKDDEVKDENLINFLEKKNKEEQEKFDVASEVQAVYKSFIGPSRSQWSQIRTLASTAGDKEKLKESIKKFIDSGISKEQWKNKNLIKSINDSENPIAFTKLLAMMVSKHTQGGANE